MDGAKPLGGRSTEVEVDDADCVVLVPRWGFRRLSCCSFVGAPYMKPGPDHLGHLRLST
jgi:hypothetical protein